jgi:phospholipid/cholesterol/gamma-HCH transport system substrate-binding protein
MTSYERGHDALKVAALAVVALVVFALLFLYMTNRGLSLRRSDLYVSMPTAAGLRKGDPVFFRGVQVGEVRKLAFAGNGSVVVRTRLLERVPLTVDAHATLVAADLFGRQTIVLNEGDWRAARLLDGDTIHGLQPELMTTRMAELGRNAERLTGDTTILLMHAALDGAGEATRAVARLSEEMRSLIDAQRASLAAITGDAATITRSVAAATDADAIVRMRLDAERTAASLAGATARMDSTAASLATLAAGLENGDGSAGMLLRDPALYVRTEALLASLEALVLDIEANPRRYINVRVF